MTITSESVKRVLRLCAATVVSNLTGAVYYHWYADGAWLGVTAAPTFSLHLDPGERVRIHCNDTLASDYDGPANAPAGYPARRTLWWTRAADADTDSYLVQQNRAGAGWTTLGLVYQRAEQWAHQFLTPVLDDLTSYEWRVVPYDRAGNAGSPVARAAEKIVRTPSAPAFAAAFSGVTQKITFTAA